MSEAKTEVKKETKVKVKLLRAVRLPLIGEGKKEIKSENTIVEVTPEEAVELCEKPFLGHYEGIGEVQNREMPRNKVFRAVRV